MASGRRRVVVADEGMAQGRTALATVRALGRAGYAPLVTVAHGGSLASSSRWCAGVIHVPHDDAAGWRSAVTAAADRESALLVMPASDSAIATLDLPGVELIDKRVVSRRAAEAGLMVPCEREYADHLDLLAHADELPYPVIVKPAARMGLKRSETVLVDRPDGLATVADGQPLIVQPFLSGLMVSVAVLVLEGRLVAAVHQRFDRIWPLGCGAASASVTVEPDLGLEEKVLKLIEGHEGLAQVELIGDHVIDINPRVYASISLPERAGVNFPGLWCDALGGGSPRQTTVRARVGVHYRWIDADVRCVVAQMRSGEIGWRTGLASLAPRRGTAHSIEDWHDPRPLAVRLGQLRRSLP